jgi:hypothetical protein
MALPAALSGPWNPLRITGTPMPPNVLLLCKVLAVAVLATGHVRILPAPFLPFIDGLDRLTEPRTFQIVLQSVAIGSALALLFNRAVRASALVLGSCLLVGVVASRAYYGNNKTFCGLALVFAGLSDFDRPPYLLRWQLSLVYFGAALNKLLDPDWQSGVFFQYWGGEKLKNPVFLAFAGWLPPLLAGKIMCWGTIIAEFGAAFGLLVPRLVPYALWANVLFQVGLLEFTGTTFTLFFYGMQAATLAFVAWPEELRIDFDDQRRFGRFLRGCLKRFDPDGLQHWHPLPTDLDARKERFETLPPPAICLVDRGVVYADFAAIQRLVLFSPVFWLVATTVLALLPGNAVVWRRLLVALVLVFCLPIYRSMGEVCCRRKIDS